MALDHRRLIRPGKKIPAEFFLFDKFILQNIAIEIAIQDDRSTRGL